MTNWIVNFGFEAASQEEAEAIVGSWVVTPDVTLLSLIVQNPPRVPYTLRYGGSVAEAFTVDPMTAPPGTPQPNAPPRMSPPPVMRKDD
jgi:hypothetical protein